MCVYYLNDFFLERKVRRKEESIFNVTASADTLESPGFTTRGSLIGEFLLDYFYILWCVYLNRIKYGFYHLYPITMFQCP